MKLLGLMSGASLDGIDVTLLEVGKLELAPAELATGGKASCDEDGALAGQGPVSEEALARLLARPILRGPPSRSTGREVSGPRMVQEVVPEIGSGRRRDLVPGETREGWPGVPDGREAAAFALLAWAHLQAIPANVPEATGSGGPRVLGSWIPGEGEGQG